MVVFLLFIYSFVDNKREVIFIFCRVFSGDIRGLDAYKVCVETDVSGGLPQFNMVGLLSSAVREARERVLTAFTNSGFDIPPRKITVNLSPANIKKQGSGFDLPIAVGILSAMGAFDERDLEGRMFVGELSLDGRINKVNGILPIALMAKEEGFRELIVPKENAFEGAVIDGISLIGVSSLNEVIEGIRKNKFIKEEHTNLESLLENAYFDCRFDYSDIRGQKKAKRATQVSVAGFHNILYIGPPGSGKSMLAKRIPTILNRLTRSESLEISKIYSVLGMLNEGTLVLNRPFRAPHHSITSSALVGGNANPKPGEITLAHKGVLFLDEAAEFKKDVIEMLRQPLEDKKVVVSRMQGSVSFPSDFMLVMAMNPCRCGYYPDRQHCTCSQVDIDRYFGKIKGPILDRIDICVGVPKLETRDFEDHGDILSSEEMREPVQMAQTIQKERFKDSGFNFNSQMERKDIEEFCRLEKKEKELMDNIYKKYNLSARGYYKILKVARTVADLEGSDDIKRAHLIEAIGYRNTFGN